MDFCPAPGISDQSIQFFSHKKSLNLASALVLALLGKENVEGLFFSNLSLGSSPAWYFHLTPFETLFCGMIILQIFVLRWVEILPINLNNWLIGDPSGRRKRSTSQRRRRVVDHDEGHGKIDHLAEATFAVLRRLDDQDCLLKSLCILQVQSLKGPPNPHIPKETKDMVVALEMSGSQRRRKTKVKCATMSCHSDIHDQLTKNVIHDDKSTKTPTIQVFEDAVLTGSKVFRRLKAGPGSSSNVTLDLCGSDYKACSVPSTDIIDYIDIIADAGML